MITVAYVRNDDDMKMMCISRESEPNENMYNCEATAKNSELEDLIYSLKKWNEMTTSTHVPHTQTYA